MSVSPCRNLKRTGRWQRIAAWFVAPAVLGILALAPPGAGSAVLADDELPGESIPEKPGGSNLIAPAIEYLPRPTKREAKISEALERVIRIDFVDLPFEDAIDFLRDGQKIPIWLDKATLTDEGVALDQPITLKLAGVTLRSVLKLLLEPLQLTYVIEDDVMKITTTGCTAAKLITRVYPVHDLYFERTPIAEEGNPERDGPRRTPVASRPGDLETAITKSINPESWETRNGPGSLTYVREAGSFVIRQTPQAHAEILQLLRDLREARRIGLAAPEPPPPRTSWRLRGPKRADTYSLVGILDLDGDGDDDSGRLRRIIKASGGSIDNDVDFRGRLTVDGELPDDGRPRVTAKTKFVILGQIPQVADLSDPEECEVSLKIAGYYKEIEEQARASGVQIIRLDEFLKYIGYEKN